MSTHPSSISVSPSIHLDPRVVIESRRAITLRAHETGSLGYHFTSAFLDLCRLIETLVLHEHIVITDVENPYDYDWAGHEILGPFLEAGVVSVERRPSPFIIDAYTEAAEDEDRVGSAMVFAAKWTFDQYLYALKNGASFIPPTNGYWSFTVQWLNHNIFKEADEGFRLFTEEIIEQVRVLAGVSSGEKSSNLLIRHYEDLKLETQRTLSLLKSYGRPIPVMIPPIVAIVLDSVRYAEAIGRAALDLRFELEPFRRRFSRFEEKIRDDNQPLGASLEAAQELQSAMRSLLEPNESRDLVALSNWRGAIDAAKAGLTGNPLEFGLALGNAILDAPLKALDRRLQRRQVTYMALLRERFLKIQEYGRLIERVFGHCIPDSDYTSAFNLLTQMNSEGIANEVLNDNA